MSPANQGLITFDKPTGSIGPETCARDFADSPLGREAAMKLDSLRTRFYLDRAIIQGKPIRVELFFEGQRLERIDVFFHMRGDSKGWEGWTQAAEQKRKETAEIWASELFGQQMEVKPFDMEDGTSVVPFEVKWDTTRRLRFAWGEIVSYYDSKAGFSGLGITFNPSAKNRK